MPITKATTMPYGSNIMSLKRISILAISAFSMAFGLQAHALSAIQKVEKEVVTTNAAGEKIVSRVPAERVTPGETVIYTVEFLNDSDAPATDLVLAMPVPTDIEFLEGSADRPGATILYSTDGGSTYASRDALALPAVDGGTRGARSEDITNIQWTIKGPVAVGQSDRVVFKGRLK